MLFANFSYHVDISTAMCVQAVDTPSG